MHSADSSDIDFQTSGSHLLSQSPLLPSTLSSSNTGHGGDDLSISELSLSDRVEALQQPFTLLAQPGPDPSTPTTRNIHDHDAVREDSDGSEEDTEEYNEEKKKRHAAKLREEKLQSDIFILKKLNASFALFNEALEDTGSANQRVAAQLEQTDALLNKYVDILSQSDEFSRLILDEQWQGAEADEEIMERERKQAEVKARREAEERVRIAQREQERLQREEQDRLQREEKERIERERKEKTMARGGIRGVRGTRASMRGVRGSTRAAPASVANRGRPSPASRNAVQTNSGGVST